MNCLLYRREASKANEIWQADHCLLPIWVRDGQGKLARPWLTVIEDDKSWAVAGYRLSWSVPSAIQTALTLRQAIWRKEDARWQVCGIPDVLYTDHGTDFTSVHLEQVGADLKMQLGVVPNMEGQRREICYNPKRRILWRKLNRPIRKNSSNKLYNSLKQVEKVKPKLQEILVFLIVL